MHAQSECHLGRKRCRPGDHVEPVNCAGRARHRLGEKKNHLPTQLELAVLDPFHTHLIASKTMTAIQASTTPITPTSPDGDVYRQSSRTTNTTTTSSTFNSFRDAFQRALSPNRNPNPSGSFERRPSITGESPVASLFMVCLRPLGGLLRGDWAIEMEPDDWFGEKHEE